MRKKNEKLDLVNQIVLVTLDQVLSRICCITRVVGLARYHIEWWSGISRARLRCCESWKWTMTSKHYNQRLQVLNYYVSGITDVDDIRKRSQCLLSTVYCVLNRIKSTEGIQRRVGNGLPLKFSSFDENHNGKFQI